MYIPLQTPLVDPYRQEQFHPSSRLTQISMVELQSSVPNTHSLTSTSQFVPFHVVLQLHCPVTSLQSTVLSSIHVHGEEQSTP